MLKKFTNGFSNGGRVSFNTLPTLKIALALFFTAVCAVNVPDTAWGAVSFGPPSSIEHRSKDVSPPAAALDDEGRVYISWIEEDRGVNSLYVSVSEDYGKTFLREVKVNGKDDEPSSIHESPSLALGKNGEVYIAWASRHPAGGFNSDLRFSKSADHGGSFEKSIKVNDNVKPGSAGFESMTTGPDGTVYISWLDGRERETKGSITYAASSKDNGKSFSRNTPVDSNSCPCCRTSIAAGMDNTVYVAWRKIYGKAREIVVARSLDSAQSFTPPVKTGPDNWEIEGCPHRGPSLKVNSAGRVFVIWYAEADGEPKIYLGSSGDKGVSFSKEEIIHKRSSFPDNAALSLLGDDVLLAWQEITPVLSKVVFEERSDKGAKTRRQMNDDARKALNPVIHVNGKGEVLLAWLKNEVRTSRSVIRIGR